MMDSSAVGTTESTKYYIGGKDEGERGTNRRILLLMVTKT
jgi:hypothetical protein